MDKRDILGSIDITAMIVGTRAKVCIAQTFTNHGKGNIEASYTFPVPPKAMVKEFTLALGDKQVTSTFEETEKAYDEYDKVIKKGDTAGIIESVRKDILELSLGNIAPGEIAKIALTYLQEIPTTDNKSQILMRIPLVVAPRYENHPTPENNRIQPVIGENHTVVHLQVEIKEFSPIQKLSSPSHRIQCSINGEKATVELALDNEKADSDFVLEIILAECSTSYTYSEGDFTLVQINPNISETKEVAEKKSPTTFGFLLDHSGSMEGSKLFQAKQALKLCLRQLSSGDKFMIVAFDDQFIRLSETPLPYTDDSMELADAWIDALTADGGTEILAPLEYLCKNLSKTGQGVVLVFTDGQVSNEEQIIRLVETNQDKMTVFPFGIDTAVNESFITGLAEAGCGVPEFIYPGERIEDKVLRHFDRILSPSWGNAILCGTTGEEIEVIPRIPSKMYPRDSYSFLFRREIDAAKPTITLQAKSGGKLITRKIKEVKGGDSTLPSWWALTMIRSLENELHLTNQRRQLKIKKEIIELSKEYQVLSTFTSLLAILPRTKKVKGVPEFIKVPVCAPREWDMIHKPSLRKFSMSRVMGNFPEGEPFMMADASVSAPPDLNILVQDHTKSVPHGKKANEVKTREDKTVEVALLQKVNGSIHINSNESLYATILFVLVFLQDSSTLLTYRQSIQKAVQYLLNQPCEGKLDYPLLQACAFQSALKAKVGESQLLTDRIKKCMPILVSTETQIFDYFCADNPTPLWRKIDGKITGSDDWEECSQILLDKILKGKTYLSKKGV
jgi:Ca-activated chloride channel family protein